MKPSTGRIVLYVLSQADCDSIEANRARMAELFQISAGQIGNSVQPGDIVPAVIVRAWSDTCINAQALLDGGDTHWLMSRNLDDGKAPGTWHWPVITPAVQPLKQPSGDGITRMGAELSIHHEVTLVQLELKIRRLCSSIESMGASADLTRASVEVSNARRVLAALIERQPIALNLRAWLEGRD